MHSRSLIIAIVAMLIVGELAAIFLPMDNLTLVTLYRCFHLLQIITLLVLTIVMRREIMASPKLNYLERERWQKISRLTSLAICFSLAGDFINSNLIDLTFLLKPQTLLSIGPFAIAHFAYIRMFFLLTPQKDEHGVSTGVGKRRMIVTAILCPLIAIALWNFLVGADTPKQVLYPSLAYSLVVVLMTLTACWTPLVWGRIGLLVALGGISFAISDSMIGYYLVRERPLWASQMIWLTYCLAQLAIVCAARLATHHSKS